MGLFSSRKSSSPKALLVSLAAVALALPAVSAQAVTGVFTGLNSKTGQRGVRRDIDDVYRVHGPHWDLYVQALAEFYKSDITNVTSFFQIASIHGVPFQAWNNVENVEGGATTGYCPHGLVTFITWHRPYMALYEQVLAGYVQAAAEQYPADQIAKYRAAADSFRIPYWDWGRDASLPAAATAKTITYNGPNGEASMANPLYTYSFQQFPLQGTGTSGDLSGFNESKRCTPNSGTNKGISDDAQASSVLSAAGSQLKDQVYNVFTQATAFDDMASTSSSGPSFEEPHNIVHNDISCFTESGYTGHMGELYWSSWDPIFYLHHCNVDRMFAMWQAINPDTPYFTTTEKGGALFGSTNASLTSSSPLKPFTSDGSTFWTSETVAHTKTFGYTYVEVPDWQMDATALAAFVRKDINRLYGSSSTTTTTKRKRDGKRRFRSAKTYRGEKDALGDTDYSIEIAVERSELPLPCVISVELDAGDEEYNAVSAHIGTTSLLSMPKKGMFYSSLPLRRTLDNEANAAPIHHPFAERGSVLNALTGRLKITITASDGASYPTTDFVSLNVTIHERSYTPPEYEDDFPKYGPVTKYSIGH